MKPRSRTKHKGRREGGSFVALPHSVMSAQNWRRCSGTAIKLLCDLASQFNGRNNGDLCAAMSVLKPMGWNSSDTVSGALKELRHYGLIMMTRQGGMQEASLYALTWHSIDDCGGKLETAPTRLAPGDWKEARSKFKRPPKKRKARPASGAEPNRHPEQVAA